MDVQPGFSKTLLENLKTSFLTSWLIYDPPSDKSNGLVFTPKKDEDQPGSMLSLIKNFAVCPEKTWIISYPVSS